MCIEGRGLGRTWVRERIHYVASSYIREIFVRGAGNTWWRSSVEQRLSGFFRPPTPFSHGNRRRFGPSGRHRVLLFFRRVPGLPGSGLPCRASASLTLRFLPHGPHGSCSLLFPRLYCLYSRCLLVFPAVAPGSAFGPSLSPFSQACTTSSPLASSHVLRHSSFMLYRQVKMSIKCPR